MVTIRMSRGGTKKRPFYHVIATDSRNARDAGDYLERLGYFNPLARGGEKRLELDLARVDYWVGVGAIASDRVATLLKEARKAAA